MIFFLDRSSSLRGNRRGFTHLLVPGKVYWTFLLKRLEKVLEKQLREEKAGFRPNSSCADQIYTLKRIGEEHYEFKQKANINFRDFCKAFDSLHHPSLWSILRYYAVPMDIDQGLHEKSRFCMKTSAGPSDWFTFLTGLHIITILFVAAINWFMDNATIHTKGIPEITNGGTLKDLD